MTDILVRPSNGCACTRVYNRRLQPSPHWPRGVNRSKTATRTAGNRRTGARRSIYQHHNPCRYRRVGREGTLSLWLAAGRSAEPHGPGRVRRRAGERRGNGNARGAAAGLTGSLRRMPALKTSARMILFFIPTGVQWCPTCALHLRRGRRPVRPGRYYQPMRRRHRPARARARSVPVSVAHRPCRPIQKSKFPLLIAVPTYVVSLQLILVRCFFFHFYYLLVLSHIIYKHIVNTYLSIAIVVLIIRIMLFRPTS